MKKYFIFLLSFLFPIICFSQAVEGRVRTEFSGKIEYWEVSLGKDEGTFEGYLMNDVNRWTFSIGSFQGEVNSEFNDKYNSWIITVDNKTYRLKTWLSSSWYRWELSGGDLKEKVNIQTLYNGSWDNWIMKRDSIEIDLTTNQNNSYEDWNITGDLVKATEGEKIAAIFLPIFVSRIYKRNLVH